MNKTIIKADKDCKYCGGNSRCQILVDGVAIRCKMLVGGVAICRCVTDQIDIRNCDNQTTKLVQSDDRNSWELIIGDDKK